MIFQLPESELDKIIQLIQPSLKQPFPSILLSGDLGVGKTRLTREIAKLFHLENQVTSPSFGILQEYANDDFKIVHVDFYRVKTFEEVLELHLDELFSDPNVLILVEWWDKYEEIFYDQRSISISIHYTDDPDFREYEVQLPE